MTLTPELVEAIGKAAGSVVGAVGGVIATVATTVVGYFTWKTRYQLDLLYASTVRAKPDGTPGPMRRHPAALARLWNRGKAPTPAAGDELHLFKPDQADMPPPPPPADDQPTAAKGPTP